MRLRILTSLAALLVSVLSGLPVAAQGSPRDSAEVRQLLLSHSDAWNRKDAKGAAAIYLSEADILTPGGDRVQGRQAIEAAHAGDFSADTAGGGSRNSHPFETLWMRFLRSDLALVEVETRFDFPPDSSGPVRPERSTLFLVLKKEHGHWGVLAQRTMQPKP
jgi:uncharacterized protein (TIGR02246 family)